MKKALLIVFLFPFLAFAQTKEPFVLKGYVTGLKDSITAFLMNANNSRTLATGTVVNGNFTLKGNVREPDMFQLGFIGYNQSTELFLQNDQVALNGDINNLGAATVTGSAVNNDFTQFKQQFIPYINRLRELGAAVNAETNPAKKDSLMKEYNVVRQQAAAATNLFMQAKPASPVSSLVLAVMMGGFDGIADVEAKYNQLQPSAKRGFYAQNIERSIAEAKQAQIGQVGTQAVDFTQQDVNGKPIALSSFRGKYVLIDFWASWCGPCRRANPFVVQMYNKYKDKKFNGGKGFEIFSVSLDQNAEAWKNAIAQDGLTWKYHVSDLGGWGSEGARIYGIQSIPQCVLVDGEGTIIGVGLRPEGVQQELESRLK
jgi:thiol-disulfide isomerase/thioredoxin